ncbi:uncharacterized protein MELLADRAFT_117945 [Melampsora larici-populina 98AG31]|uniref:Uncharacterized protein n=1 Tax=Melampsora larici-populina (strain 98AG31 / pathotype 3-4-7) TaxID=747676 RepID=F4S3C0_MELLP|nr:uncharacterized protein MELLADRAFT_117945 [Melampsora larici-populina 98AG31]EGG00867.1 hypothetical protein MELLADRAFT_117945 [Melampsora larici-populina 98AG31]
MAPTTFHTSHSSDSTLLKSQTKKQITRHPTTVPLPPSPPATETLNLDDGLPEPIEMNSRTRRSKDASNQPITKPYSQPRRNSKLTNKRTRQDELDSRSIEPASPISSPLNSPTNRKSFHPHKRTKIEKPKTSKTSSTPVDEESIVESSTGFRDSPRNPFLVKEGESVRQAGQFHDEKSRKLVYVFRGKRIQYDPGEDLHNTGDSPFTLSAPKLLFPTSSVPPSPPPKLEFETDPSESLKSMIDPFQTPKKNKKPNDHHEDGSSNEVTVGLPTPQQTRQKRLCYDLLGGSNQVEVNGSKGKQTISKGMR